MHLTPAEIAEMTRRTVMACVVALNLWGCAKPVDYVASQKSEIFHKSACSEAAHIKSQNLIHFTDRDQATQKHRPCEVCKP